MEEVIIEKYKPTGELCATIDFGRKSVDWNKIHEELRSGCHCIWAESDLESYVTVLGKEEKCVCTTISQLKKSLIQVVDE